MPAELITPPEGALDAEELRLLRAIEKLKDERPWKLYSAIPAIRRFHMSRAPIRVLAGPNRGGKTTAGAFELVSVATGYHPMRKERFATPNVCWAISLDHQNMGAIMRRKLLQMLPKGTRYRVPDGILVLPKPWNSEIYLKSVDSEPEKFQGEGLTAAWFDEEPVGEKGHRVFKEVYARRTPGIPLQIFMTFTPLQGLSWSYRYLWDQKSEDLLPGVETFSFDLYDCLTEKGGFLSEVEVQTIAAGYNEWERKARVHGQYTVMGGSPYWNPTLIERAIARSERYERYRIEPIENQKKSWKLIPSDIGELHVLRPPIKGHRYILGVDVAGGVGRDFTVASVWDIDDVAEVAYWMSNRMDPTLAASRHIMPLGYMYNTGTMIVEMNGDHGGTAISAMRVAYPKLYMRQEWDAVKRTTKNEYGFRTWDRTRGRVLDVLSMHLREETWKPSEHMLTQMGTFIITTSDVGGRMRADHQEGCHDDHLMAAGIALAVLAEQPPPKYKAWTHYKPKFHGAGVDSW